MLLLFHGLEMSFSGSNKATCLLKTFSENSNLYDLGIFLSVFPSRTNLRLHNISVIPKMVKKVIRNLDWSKALGPDSGGSNEL